MSRLTGRRPLVFPLPHIVPPYTPTGLSATRTAHKSRPSFNTANYRISGLVKIGPNVLKTTQMVIETGAGHNLIKERFVSLYLIGSMGWESVRTLTFATVYYMRVSEILHISRLAW